MASSSPNHVFALLVLVVACTFSVGVVHGQLSSTFYSRSCPTLQGLVRNVVTQAVNQDRRMAASLLRMFFHDCFVNGCDASVLLDDTATFTGEKNALPNKNSLRGFDVIDSIKTRVDAACNGTVSCADILALATLEGVAAVGGPRWSLGLGRRDATTASLSDANNELPSPFSDLSTLISKFATKGLSARDMTALSGGNTIGQAQCFIFRNRIYNETNIDAAFASARRVNCPSTGGDSNLAPLDSTATRFDNSYFKDLVARRGLLHSDQELFNGGSQDALVRMYSTNGAAFTADFAAAMTKMSNLGPLTGTSGQIRRNCRVVN